MMTNTGILATINDERLRWSARLLLTWTNKGFTHWGARPSLTFPLTSTVRPINSFYTTFWYFFFYSFLSFFFCKGRFFTESWQCLNWLKPSPPFSLGPSYTPPPKGLFCTWRAWTKSEENATLVSEEVIDLISCSKWFLIFHLLTLLRWKNISILGLVLTSSLN